MERADSLGIVYGLYKAGEAPTAKALENCPASPCPGYGYMALGKSLGLYASFSSQENGMKHLEVF